MFCTNCGSKAVEGDKFCVKCGTPILVLPGIAPQSSMPHNTAPQDSMPHNTAPPVIEPVYTIPPNTTQVKTAPPATAPSYYIPPPAVQRVTPVPKRKSKFMPILIVSVSVVTVVLIVVALYFALGPWNTNPADNDGPGKEINGPGEVNPNADGDRDPSSESGSKSDPIVSPPPGDTAPGDTIPGGNEDEFGLTGDGTGFIFHGVEFQIYEVLLNSMFAPGDMPSGHKPFMIRFTFNPEEGTEDITSLLYESGYFMVDDERAEFGAAMLKNESVTLSIYSLVSSCSQITDSSTITLHIGDYVFKVQ